MPSGTAQANSGTIPAISGQLAIVNRIIDGHLCLRANKSIVTVSLIYTRGLKHAARGHVHEV